MVAPGVLSVIVTVTEDVNVPPAGLTTGVATVCWMVYVALATPLSAIPVAVAMARMVVVWVTEIGPLYAAEAAVGVLPSTVKWMIAPGVPSVIVTVTDDVNVPPAGLRAGVATTCCWMVYVALATPLSVIPLFEAMARMVVVWVTEMGPLYGVEAAVGVLPSVV